MGSRKMRRDDARAGRPHRSMSGPQGSMIESLEGRTLLSVAASAQLALVSTTGTQANPVYNYDITVTDTGTTNVGTFWFGWVPGEDFLPTPPISISNPTGWSNTTTGSGNSTDGTAIEWVATSNAITAGHSLSGFAFSTTDSPTALAGNSPDFPSSPAMTAFVYSGGPFSDGGFQLVVAPAATQAASTTNLQTSDNSISAGDSVTFTVVVAPAGGQGVIATGSVSFSQDGNNLGSANLISDGTATFTTSSLPVGTDHITASYGGDSNYLASVSSPLTETVAPPLNAVATTVTLISSLPTAPLGGTVQLTATVTPAVTGAALTGNVSFAQDGTVVGNAPVQADGTAILTTSTLPLGADSIVATYSGDSSYLGSTSSALIQTITQPLTLVPTIVKSTLPSAVVAGDALKGSITLSITNQSGANIKGKGTIEIFASTTGVIDGSSVLLGQISKTLNVSTTKPAKASVSIKSAVLPTGTFTLFARVTDASSNVNDSAAGATITAAASFVALSEAVTKNSLPAAATNGAKARGAVTISITNGGNITTPGTTSVTLFATSSGTIDGSAIQLATFSKALHIRPGKPSRASLKLKELPVMTPGSYTLVVQVIDGNGQATEVTVGPIAIS
ncbi:MAG TPA: Ig-like domain-containing protein [Humisphaera sp.]|jgi:hypothetical protein|nr:Ig-like domain-containing protein [Humisphaera sp.]